MDTSSVIALRFLGFLSDGFLSDGFRSERLSDNALSLDVFVFFLSRFSFGLGMSLTAKPFWSFKR
jgi:hypothetical protein